MDLPIIHDMGSQSDAVDRLEEFLLEHEVAKDGDAARLAAFVVHRAEAELFDAAIWRAAERLIRLLDRDDDVKLRDQPLAERIFYVTVALKAVLAFEDALRGVTAQRDIEQATADWLSHKAQLGRYAERLMQQTARGVLRLMENG